MAKNTQAETSRKVIEVNTNKTVGNFQAVKDENGKIVEPARSVTVPAPDVLNDPSLQFLLDKLGEQMVLQKVLAQLMIDFRSKIRGMLESETDGAPNYSDEDITAADYSDWAPEHKVRKSKEEKAADALKDLVGDKKDPDSLKAALSKLGIDLSDLK
jgi:hypothetical protein